MSKTKIQIKSIWGTVLFEREAEDNTLRATIEAAAERGADLSGANLSGANLSVANLSVANLSGADLSGANLYEADLSGANLSVANLSGADLSGANLRVANLRVANLSVANLSGADLSGANLYEADLSGADLSGANLRVANLSGQALTNLPTWWVELCSRDMLYVFEHLKHELPFLREAIVAGRINGTQYSGDCACLIGTLGKAPKQTVNKVCAAMPNYTKGLHNPSEQWFWNIRVGDTPKTSDFAKHAVALIDQVLGAKKPRAKRAKGAA